MSSSRAQLKIASDRRAKRATKDSEAAQRQRRKSKDSMMTVGATRRLRGSKEDAKWKEGPTKFVPTRRLTDHELTAARRMFFDLDKDGSGSIDEEELATMLRSLGQNPTEEEVRDLIRSVDEGDYDGKIQLREFLKLYSLGIDGHVTGAKDVNDCFSAMGGDPRDKEAKVNVDMVKEIMSKEFDLEVRQRAALCARLGLAPCMPALHPRSCIIWLRQVDLGTTFGVANAQLSREDFEQLLLTKEQQ